jgi:hypothetical protein
MAQTSVTVGLKLPQGLILRLFKMEDATGPGYVPGERRAVEYGERVRIRGTAHEEGMRPKVPIVGGYALTSGVPKDFWDAWLEQNKDSDLIRNKLIFAYSKVDSAKAAAREHKSTRSGLERLDTSTRTVGDREVPNDPRWPVRANANITPIATDTGE